MALSRNQIAEALSGGSTAYAAFRQALEQPVTAETLTQLLKVPERAIESKFVRELYLRTPDSAWNPLSPDDVKRGLAFIDQHNGWPTGTTILLQQGILAVQRAKNIFG